MRRRARRGEPIASIARAVGVSEPTARKYARADDLSPEPPRRRQPGSEVLAPYEGTIDSWLDDDCKNWRKQRHTAVRVYVRLRDELGYGGSYSTVQRYVRRRREEMARERDQRDAQGYLQLDWLPGEVQVDLGESDSGVRGVLTRGKHLTAAFPHPDVGPHPGLLGRDLRARLPGARERLRVRRRRAPQGGLRQRHRGRQARRGRGQDLGALPTLRGALRARPRPRRPPRRQREGQRREQGRVPQEEPLRAHPVVPRRRLVQPQAPRGLPRPRRGQAPPRARHARARAVRGGQGRPLAAATGGVLVREVGDQGVQQAGHLHRRWPPPILGRSRLRAPRGRRRPGRLRRHGLRRLDRGGGRHLRARVGRGPDRQLGPHAAAGAALHGARGPGGLERQGVVAGGARVLPGRGGPRGPRLRPQGAARRERRARLARRRGGHVALARGHRRRRPRVGRPVRGEGRGGRRARRVRRGGRPGRLRRGAEVARGR